jgi:hypothetical protein
MDFPTVVFFVVAMIERRDPEISTLAQFGSSYIMLPLNGTNSRCAETDRTG